MTSFLHPLDVGELYGVGEKTRELLHRLGLVTVGDVAHTPLAHPAARRSARTLGSQLHAPGLGRRPARDHARARATDEPDKTMGADETFGRDTDDREVIAARAAAAHRPR